MEYIVRFENGMYVLEDDSGKKHIMMKPWWPFLPGDRVRENGIMSYKLVWRKEATMEGIVIKSNRARVRVRFPETAPLFQTFVAVHYPVLPESIARIHCGSDGSIILLEIKQQIRRPAIIVSPKMYNSPAESPPMPRHAH